MSFDLQSLISRAFVLLTVMPIHEYAHAAVASWLGDDTAEYHGRLTLNPFNHLDLMGSILILFAGFGWAKPSSYISALYGTKGGMEITDKVKLYTECNDYLADINICDDKIHGLMEFEGEMAHFVDCIKNGTECKAPAKDGVDIMRILDAIYESAETGHEVLL